MTPLNKKTQTANASIASGEGHITKAVNQDAVEVNIERNYSKINPVSERSRWIQFGYTDEMGEARLVSLRGKTAKRFIHMWWKRFDGLTQAGVPKGYTLKDYVFRFASCEKSKYFMQFHRVWEEHEGGRHRRYWLKTEITWLAEKGFPEIRSHIRKLKG
jgi:hypothetical protein